MKKIFLLLFFAIALSCKKSTDIPIACTFTFASIAYKATSVQCRVYSDGARLMEGKNGDSFTLELLQEINNNGQTVDNVLFLLQNGLHYYQSTGTGPFIIRSGNTMTFDAPMEDHGTAAGTISGTCKCQTGSL